jgi:hypothetical protein
MFIIVLVSAFFFIPLLCKALHSLLLSYRLSGSSFHSMASRAFSSLLLNYLFTFQFLFSNANVHLPPVYLPFNDCKTSFLALAISSSLHPLRVCAYYHTHYRFQAFAFHFSCSVTLQELDTAWFAFISVYSLYMLRFLLS